MAGVYYLNCDKNAVYLHRLDSRATEGHTGTVEEAVQKVKDGAKKDGHWNRFEKIEEADEHRITCKISPEKRIKRCNSCF